MILKKRKRIDVRDSDLIIKDLAALSDDYPDFKIVVNGYGFDGFLVDIKRGEIELLRVE